MKAAIVLMQGLSRTSLYHRADGSIEVTCDNLPGVERTFTPGTPQHDCLKSLLASQWIDQGEIEDLVDGRGIGSKFKW